MTKITSRHLLDILAEVPDSRNNRGKRHSLPGLAYDEVPSGDALIVIWQSRIHTYLCLNTSCTFSSDSHGWATVILEDLTPQTVYTNLAIWQNFMRDT